MTTTLDGLEFDPGFAPYILTFTGAVECLYADINKHKNFTQKKFKFMQYHKKILSVLDNNLGFYVGCLMWAVYIKTEPKQKLLSNHCYGQEYDKDQNVAEQKYMQKFVELFPQDMKYYLAKDFSFDENVSKLLSIYEEFLTINKGFVKSKYNTDIRIPSAVKTADAESFKSKIESVLKTKDLSKLLEYLPEII